MSTTWLFCGDSVTQGAKHTGGLRDYTQLLAERVRFELNRPADVVINTAVSGARLTVPDFSRFRAGVVSIMYGLNDCLAGPDGLPAFRAGLHGLVRKAAPAQVVLHTPNPVLPTAVPARLEWLTAYVAVVREVAAAHPGVVLVDHHAGWGGRAPGRWMADDCHPNGYGHRALAGALLRALDLWDPDSPLCSLPT
ncbi:SGNH/GDSL hydrolase family protein [Nonomuraea sp. MG754425]|uniref:SGNH/GDSL hydrolase family protein n=1 Tax=Nonomuraea sp. MG754425 TaxID=2570319 RepID=UPI001F1FA0A0|nr:SGNH/GDSL hydrolase family protein [Nonomuraea sp. MG754425]MCF6466999.1 SGNH/GDSL hydrolase family protein [Nonomuraea sp. MG754425]